MISDWNSVPPEAINLLNPAFGSLIIYSSIKSYWKNSGKSMPYSTAFLILPIVLHKKCRDKMPRSISTKLHNWVNNNPELKINFASRVKQLSPFIKESILFGIKNKVISMDNEGGLLPNLEFTNLKKLWEENSESENIRLKSEFFGKWIKDIESSQLYNLWGIRP